MILKEQHIVEFNKPNKNGRVYSSECFDLDDPILQEKLKTGVLFGELGFPEDELETDLSKVSHRVISLYKEGDGLYADIEILNTPSGRILEELVKNKVVWFSIRGTGNLIPREDGNYDVTDYALYTINATENPA